MCTNVNFNKFVLNCKLYSRCMYKCYLIYSKYNVQLYEANTAKTQQRKPNREEEGISDLKSLN